MRIDHTQRSWAIATSIALLVAIAIYVPYAMHVDRVSGGSVVGLTFGISAFGCMLFAALLGWRKKHPIWRVGRMQAWMRGHLWLGALSLPLVLLHGGFHAGGVLTTVLLWLTFSSVISGIIGALIQHSIPRLLTRQVAMETIYSQIGRVREQLVIEADETVERIKAAAKDLVGASSAGGETTVSATVLSLSDTSQFESFYTETVRPYIALRATQDHLLGSPLRTTAAFLREKTRLPESAFRDIAALEEICDEKRGLDRQITLHRVLHAWLLIHVPLSLALLMLAVIHAVGALLY